MRGKHINYLVGAQQWGSCRQRRCAVRDPMLDEQWIEGLMFSHRQLVSTRFKLSFTPYTAYCFLLTKHLKYFYPLLSSCWRLYKAVLPADLLYAFLMLSVRLDFSALWSNWNKDITPNIILRLFFTQTGRSFRSYPANHSPRPSQSDRISGCNGTALLPCKWRYISRDFMGEGRRETSGKYTSTDLDGKWHVANRRRKGVYVFGCVRMRHLLERARNKQLLKGSCS